MRTIIVGGGRVGLSLAERLEKTEKTYCSSTTTPTRSKNPVNGHFARSRATGRTPMSSSLLGRRTRRRSSPRRRTTTSTCWSASSRRRPSASRRSPRESTSPTTSTPSSHSASGRSTSMATAWSLENVLERPSLSAWMNELGRTGDVQEIEVTAPTSLGRRLPKSTPRFPTAVSSACSPTRTARLRCRPAIIDCRTVTG